MRLCVLESSYEGLSSDFAAHDGSADLSDLSAGHELERHALVKATAVDEVRRLASRGFDVFVNFCDGARDEERAGIEVVRGARSASACPSPAPRRRSTSPRGRR